jgi:hypothetical protein
VSGRLALRRGVVVGTHPLQVVLAGERRRAWADEALLGEMREGDEVVVNVAAIELGLGSGGFDVVHVNLTRGLEGAVTSGEHVMKLNYTSLQHPVAPVEADPERRSSGPKAFRVLVVPLHGHLAPAAWAAAEARPGLEIGYVQTGGGALPGNLSRDVRALRERGLLAGHIAAAPAYGGEHEALSTVGAIDAARDLGWDAVVVGSGPGIIGSNTEFGHGGVVAVESAHAALSLKLPTLISPRLSCSDPRERHLHLSHHTYTLLELLLAPVEVAVPEGEGIEGVAEARDRLETATAQDGHTLSAAPVDLDGYAAAGLPTSTMGRTIAEDSLFFAAPLAAGRVLAEPARRG